MLIVPASIGLFGGGFPSGATGYTIENAIWFDGSADYLTRTPIAAGTEETWTYSVWLKRSAIGSSSEAFFEARADGNNTGALSLNSDSLYFQDYDDGVGTPAFRKQSNAKFRDPTAWMHIIAINNTSNGTAEDRHRLYVNGVRVTGFSPNTNSSSGYASAQGINSTNPHYIGFSGSGDYFNGYMAECVFIDGTAVTSTVDSDDKLTDNELGEFDSNGVWVPKDPSTNIDDFGTNGFHLKFDETNLLGKSSNSTTNPTVSHLGSVVQTSAQQTHTITAALGTAASNRSIVIAVGGGRNNAGTRSVSTLTLEDSGGTARNATFIARKNSGAGNVTEFWYIAAGTSFGTSGEIVVTYTGGDNNMITCGISWWRVLDAGQPISTNGNTGSSWSTQAVTTIGQTGDVAFYAIYDEGNADAYAWSDATERSEHIDITATRSFTSADYTFDAAESHTETATISGGQGNDNGFLGVTFSNNNSFTATSLAAANKVTDTPTDDVDNNIGNYCTWNPVGGFPSGKVSLSNGNTTATVTPDGAILANQFFDVTDSDGFYWETKFTSNISNAEHVGIGQATVPLHNTGYRDNGIATYLSDGGSEGTASGSLGTTGNRASGGTHDTWQTNNDIISVAVKGGAIWFAKNNVWQDGANGGSSSATVLSEINAGTTTNAFFTGLTGFWAPMIRGHSGSATTSTTNWGATAFTYTPPTDMKRLMTANRSAPTVTDPSAYFFTKTYTGNSDSENPRNVTGFQDGAGNNITPDWVWIKSRSNGYSHTLWDSVRGFGNGKELLADASSAEGSQAGGNGNVSGVVAGGFTATESGSDSVYVNEQGVTYVAWMWKAGGAPTADNSASTGATPTAGSFKIDDANRSDAHPGTIKTIRGTANTTAGFAILKYNGGDSDTTLGTGLTIPTGTNALAIIKKTSASNDWHVSYEVDGTIAGAEWNNPTASTTAEVDNFHSDSGTTITIDATSGLVNDDADYICYLWKEIAGYSKIGKYTGNTTSGSYPYVNCGFRPAWVMIKRVDGGTHHWRIWDSARSVDNVVEDYLSSSSAGQEYGAGVGKSLDFLANGFKIQTTDTDMNTNTGTHLFLAFAENPFGGDGVAQAKTR
tara:strand:- start:1704 stop:5009 length:3306 start_codon:yes stop_codon:yes gene_type:complete